MAKRDILLGSAPIMKKDSMSKEALASAVAQLDTFSKTAPITLDSNNRQEPSRTLNSFDCCSDL